MRVATAAAALLTVWAVTAATFWPVTSHAFLNWDDPDVVAANPAVAQPLPARVAWAATTDHMGHYQPLSWLVIGAVAGTPASAVRVHTAAVLLHAFNAALFALLVAHLLPRDPEGERPWWPAAAAAMLFALHPMRVEPVAWASALPYLLSYGPLLVGVLAWVEWTRTGRAAARWTAVGLFGVSQLARVTAPLLPVGLVLLARVVPGARPLTWRALGRAALPMAGLATPLAVAEALARDPTTLADVGLAPRIAWTLTHPVQYLWRMLWPGPINPLHALPRTPAADWDVALVAALASVLLVVTTWQAVSGRLAAALWGTYALLLAPVVGAFPSGQQLTADRYTYGPALVVAAALAAALARLERPLARGAALVSAGAAAVALSQATRAELPPWRDALSLWTRAVALDGDNDVAHYNLALAEIDLGHTDIAIRRLEHVVALVPDHGPARTRLAQLLADRDQRTGEAHAASRRFAQAVLAFTRALDADPARPRLRASRGLAHAELGDWPAAADDLGAAVEAGVTDVAVMSGLAYALMRAGREAAAADVLRRAVGVHPTEPGLSLNLARLLASAGDGAVRQPAEALALAARLNAESGGGDPRVLDTLALALAATGRTAEARDAWTQAAARAREAGDAGLAAELDRRRDSLGR